MVRIDCADYLLQKSNILSEEEIQVLLKEKTNEAYEKVILSYVPLIIKALEKYKINDIMLKENCYTRALVDIYKACETYDSEYGSKFYSYVSRTIENSIRNEIRQYTAESRYGASSFNTKMTFKENDNCIYHDEEVFINEPYEESSDEHLGMVIELEDYIDNLEDERDKEILRLRWFSDCSAREVAKILGIGVTTVYKVLRIHQENVKEFLL